jgi:hypothetical protein
MVQRVFPIHKVTETQEMTNVLRLFKRNLTSTGFDAKAAQMGCWICSLIVMVAGILKLTRLQLTEAELFFGVLLVMAVTVLGIIAGLLMPIVEFVAQKQKE